jgi:hypothetical protein
MVPGNLALGGKPLRLDGNIIAAVGQRCDLGIVPLIAQPLSVRESGLLGPGDQGLCCLDHAAYYGKAVGPCDKDKVLLRWKLSDGSYEVIYGDLRAEAVPFGRLRALEGR